MRSTTVLAPGEREALAAPGFDRLALGPVGRELAASPDPAARVRLARYEQFVGRETEADARLSALIADPATPEPVRREADSLRRLGIAFEPAFDPGFGAADWAAAPPPAERDGVGPGHSVGGVVALELADLRALVRDPVTLPGLGHNAHVEDPVAVVDLVLPFA